MLRKGQRVGRYRIVQWLAGGGMADIYLAEDSAIKRQVAIKVIRSEGEAPTTQAGKEAARLFQREAKAIGQLDHPQILPLYDYGEAQLEGMLLLYLVMPYCPEGSLTTWVEQHFPNKQLPSQVVTHFVRQAAAALQHAHNHQIIHSDVKPSNFLLRQRGETLTYPDLLLADFGIARIATATASMSQAVRGSPTYMAPEQWQAEAIPATDQYALAIMAYELLTGRPPFQGTSMRLMHDHLYAAPPAPDTFNALLPKAVNEVLLTALSKRPEERFASISAFANAFGQAMQRAAPPSVAVSGPVLASSPQATLPVAPAPSLQLPAPVVPAESDIHHAQTSISNPVPESIYHTPTLITNWAPATTQVMQETAPVADAEAAAPTRIEIGEPTRDTSKQSGPTPAAVPGVLFPKPGAKGSRRLLKGWKRKAVLAVLVILLLASGALGYLSFFGVTLNATYTFTTVPEITNISRQQVDGRFISLDSLDSLDQQGAPATGGPAPATQAHGALHFVNNAPQPVSLPQGMVLDETYGGPGCAAPIEMVLDADVTIPASPDRQYGQGVVAPAHVLHYGAIGNIPAWPDKKCFDHFEGDAGSNDNFIGWITQNDTPFTGGRDAILQQSDIDRAAQTLMASLPVPNPRQEVGLVITPNERLLDTPAPACQPKVTADHAVGDTVGEALVTIFYICTGYVYDHDGAVQLATRLLAERYGSFFKPKGQVTANVISAVLIDPQKGTIRLTVAAEGTLVFQW